MIGMNRMNECSEVWYQQIRQAEAHQDGYPE